MNIIGIIASQRKEGNTDFIVNKLLEGAKEQGGPKSNLSVSAILT